MKKQVDDHSRPLVLAINSPSYATKNSVIQESL